MLMSAVVYLMTDFYYFYFVIALKSKLPLEIRSIVQQTIIGFGLSQNKNVGTNNHPIICDD